MENMGVYNFKVELELCPADLLIGIGNDGLSETNSLKLNNYLNYLERQCKGINEYVKTSQDNENIEVIANVISNKLDDILAELELLESIISVTEKEVLSRIEVIRAMVISIIGE